VKNNQAQQKDIESLLSEWRQERAFRVVHAMSRYGLLLSLVAMLVDISFHVQNIVLFGDIALVGGCAVALQLSVHRSSQHSAFAWVPLYFGLWIACTTSIATTGALNSPLHGGYWTLLYLGGLLMQTRFRHSIVSGFILANIAMWMFLDSRFPDAFGTPPPIAFSVWIHLIILITLFLFVSEFMRTERDLGHELLRRFQELTKTREDLSRQEAANTAKSTFLANVSHELRTPLGAILGYAELLLAPDILAPEKEKFADTIHRNGRQLSRLVDDLLDLSKAEAGKIELEKTSFSLKAAINEVVELLHLPASQKGLDLQAVYRGSLPEFIFTDCFRFKQVLRNIVGNAIKFTSSGHVTITTTLIRLSASKCSLQIEIEDTGIGLSTEEQKRIFKAFSQADASIARQFGGTGLGLNLSRNLSQLLGGDLRLAWSRKGVGSCFVFQLPLSDLEIKATRELTQTFISV
jgi:signal transduction histidine kinase